MATTVIELNSLPYAIGPAAENHDFFLCGGRGFVFFFVGGVKIRSEALEFGGASINPFVDRLNFMFLAQVADFFLIAFATQAPGSGEASIGEAHALGFAQHFPW